MRYYNSIEEAHKAARNRAKYYRTATDLIPTVNQILKDFDNKVYNCRLEKALKEEFKDEEFTLLQPDSSGIFVLKINGRNQQQSLLQQIRI